MRLVGLLPVLFAQVWAAGCPSAQNPSPAEDKYRISEITLERSGSWGVQSGYRVVLRNDGTAEYVGDVHAKRKGKHRGRISEEQFGRLARAVVENDFFSLEEKYQADVTDSDTVTTSIAYSGGRKRVVDFGRGGGERLTRVEQEIDKVAEQVAWVKDEG